MDAQITACETLGISKTTFDKMQKIKLPGESDDDFIARLIEKADEDLIGIDEVASMLHLAKGTVYHLTSLHLIPFYTPGKYLISSRKQILAYIPRRRFLSHEDTRDEAARMVAK